MDLFEVLSGAWPEGELGSRFDAGAAPATVAERKVPTNATGSELIREGVGKSERTAPEPGNQPGTCW